MAPFFISRNNILLNPKSYSDFNNLSRILFTLFKYAKNINLVGVAGLEPATSASRTQRATKLRHTPVELEFYNNLILFQYREYVDY